MDFITRLPKVQGKDCVYVVVDRLTKFALFFGSLFHIQPHKLLNYFFVRFLDCMDYHETLLVTEIVSL